MISDPGRNVMDSSAPPVVEDPTLPVMPPEGADDAGVMGAGEPSPAPGASPMPEPAPTPEDEDTAEYAEMEGPVRDSGTGPREEADFDEGYLRLVIDVNDGELTLVDAAVVDGPVVFGDLSGQMAYDVVLRGRRVAADAFDDLAVRHSYPPPDSPEDQHLVGQTSHYQFIARIPRSEITTEELADLEVTLMRPPTTRALSEQAAAAPGLPLEAAAVAAGGEPPEVIGRLRGIDLGSLGSPAAEAVRSRLR